MGIGGVFLLFRKTLQAAPPPPGWPAPTAAGPVVSEQRMIMEMIDAVLAQQGR
jgi:hypothetical protein